MIPRVLPDLTLPAHTGETVALRPQSADDAEQSLLVFVPYAFTPVCTDELAAVADLEARLRARGIRPLVLSCDTKYALRAWTEAELGDRWDAVPLLSDFWPHGRVARLCGVFDERRGGPHRTALLIDADGTVRDRESADFGSSRDLGRFAG